MIDIKNIKKRCPLPRLPKHIDDLYRYEPVVKNVEFWRQLALRVGYKPFMSDQPQLFTGFRAIWKSRYHRPLAKRKKAQRRRKTPSRSVQQALQRRRSPSPA